ncbi:MAG: NAD(P)-binding domain-containing protein [Geodermatophilaceae bacterium]|nr:NAD(P)-binding domain-containing protein [Geodermatophilaceae bacterium]
MRIATIGSGAMASTLGSGWAAAGHDIFIGGRSPAQASALASQLGPRVRSGSLAEAAGFGDVILLAVPGQSAVDAVLAASSVDGGLAGRVVIDCTNALPADAFAAAPGSFRLEIDAVAERVADAAPGARVVKAFNMCAAEVWRDAARAFEGRPLAVPLCGNDPAALDVVAALTRDLGLHPVLSGGLDRARYLEAMTVFVMGLWFAGTDARATLPPLEAAAAVPD